jgi:hypothetical protein
MYDWLMIPVEIIRYILYYFIQLNNIKFACCDYSTIIYMKNKAVVYGIF